MATAAHITGRNSGPARPWLFPSTLAGRHLHTNTVMDRLRDLGVNLLGARNRAIGELVLEVPPSLAPKHSATARRSPSSTRTKPPSPGRATPDVVSQVDEMPIDESDQH
jgi:hypothetical protein